MNVSVDRQIQYRLRAPKRQWGGILLAIYAALQWFSLGRDLLAKYMGLWVTDVAGELNAASVVILALCTIWFARKYGFRLNGVARLWWLLVAGIVAINAARGFGQGLLGKYVTYDTLSFAVILCFVVLGSIPEAFEQIRQIWFWVLLASLPLNIVALTDLSDLTGELSAGVRVARETISYRTQNALDVIVLCVAFAFEYPRWKRLVTAGAMALVFLQQTLYQKRLETAFYLILLLVIAFIWLGSRYDLRQKLRGYIVGFGAILAVLVLAAFFAKSDIIMAQGASLLKRTTGQLKDSGDDSFSGGFARYILLENERFRMVHDSLVTFTLSELVLGRGMGGGVELTEFNSALLDSEDAGDFWASYYMEDYGFFGRRGFEAGIATPILKGGLILWLVYYSGFFLIACNWGIVSRSFDHRIAFSLVFLLLSYTIYGGDFTLSASFQMANMGMCLGCCLAAVSNGLKSATRLPKDSGYVTLRTPAVGPVRRRAVVGGPPSP